MKLDYKQEHSIHGQCIAQAYKEAQKQAQPLVDQAKEGAAQAQAKLQQIAGDVTGGSSGGAAAQGELDKGQTIDSDKLAAMSDLLANTLGSGRL